MAIEPQEQQCCLQTSELWPGLLIELSTNTHSVTLRKSLPPFKPVFHSEPGGFACVHAVGSRETPSKVLSPEIKKCLLLYLACRQQQLQGTLGSRVKEAVSQGGRE